MSAAAAPVAVAVRRAVRLMWRVWMYHLKRRKGGPLHDTGMPPPWHMVMLHQHLRVQRRSHAPPDPHALHAPCSLPLRFDPWMLRPCRHPPCLRPSGPLAGLPLVNAAGNAAASAAASDSAPLEHPLGHPLGHLNGMAPCLPHTASRWIECSGNAPIRAPNHLPRGPWRACMA